MAEREFEADLERMFQQAPAFADNEAFARRVEARLDKNWRLRALGIASAGAIGGLIALTQTIRAGLGLEAAEAASSRSVAHADGVVDSLFSQVLGAGGDLAANMGVSVNLMGMMAVALVLAGAAAVSMRLFDEV
jgi:hypothetical protein